MCSHPDHATRKRTDRLTENAKQIVTVCDRCGETLGQPTIEEVAQWR